MLSSAESSVTKAPPINLVDDLTKVKEEQDTIATSKKKLPIKLKDVKLAKAEPISLKSLPQHTLPTDLTQTGYSSFIVPLTKKGVAEAMELTGKSKHVLCLICLDSGKSVDASLRADIIGKSGGNLSRHFKNHLESGEVTASGNRTMTRIIELKDTVFGPVGHTILEANEMGDLRCTKTATTKVELEKALLAWIHEQGISFGAVTSPKFREMLAVAKTLKGTKLAQIGCRRIKNLTLEQFETYKAGITKIFQSFTTPRVHIIHDGWEHHGKKYLGISAAFIKIEHNQAEFQVVPLGLKRLDVDFNTSTIQSDDALLKVIQAELTSLKLEKTGVASLKSDNAANGISCAFFDHESEYAESESLGYKYFAGPRAGLFQDHEPSTLQGCISHSIALAASYGLGIKKTANPSSDMPCPPYQVEAALEAARNQCIYLRTPKMLSAAKQVAAADSSGRLSFVVPTLENATRWWSLSRMLRCVILNRNVTKELGIHSQISVSQFVLLQEVHAIIQPLTDVALCLTQISTRPIGPATLPLIYFILSRYGFEVNRGIYSSIHTSSNIPEETEFAILKIDGEYDIRPLNAFSSQAREFYRTWTQHLIYRLHAQRDNRFFYEVVGMLLDPVMKSFARMVFAPPEFACSQDWNVSEAIRWCHRALEKVRESFKAKAGSTLTVTKVREVTKAVPSMAHKRVKLNGASAKVDSPTIDQEMAIFQAEVHPVFSDYVDDDGEIAINFDDFCHILKSYDPIAYWNGLYVDPHVRPAHRFPTIYEINLATLPYMASSAFQERVFSCAERILDDRRSRLSDKLAEACALLNVLASNERGRSRLQLKRSSAAPDAESAAAPEIIDKVQNLVSDDDTSSEADF